MIKWFKQNEVLQLVVILATTLMLWLPAIMHPVAMQTGHDYAPIYSLCYSWLHTNSRLATLLALLLVVVEGFLFNLLLYNHKMVGANTLMPTWLYIVVMSATPAQLTLTPMVMANLPLIGMISMMTVKEDLSISMDNIFNAALLVAIASLCYTPSVVMLVVMLILFTVHNLYNWRHWVMLLLGFLAPIIVVATYYFLNDRLYYVSFLTRMNITDIHFSIATANTLTWICNGLLLAVLLITLFNGIANANDRVQMFRKNNRVLTLFLLGGVMMLLYSDMLPTNPQMVALPLSYLASYYLMGVKRRLWLYNTLLLLIIILFIAANWIRY